MTRTKKKPAKKNPKNKFTTRHPLCRIARGDFLVSARIKHRRLRQKHRRLLRLALTVLLLFGAVRSFEGQISAFSERYFPTFARQVTTRCVTEAVEEALDDLQLSYGDIAAVRYSEGEVCAIETDAAAVNRLKNCVVKKAEEKAEKIHNSVMHVPLGAFTGLTLIANCGPQIPLTYCLTGSFSAELVSSFASAGMNQTVHRIRLEITATVITASVDFEETLTYTTDYEVAQSVIAGRIPQSYGGRVAAVR